jgi:hypothetical protein
MMFSRKAQLGKPLVLAGEKDGAVIEFNSSYGIAPDL